jgi:hypothetical protein
MNRTIQWVPAAAPGGPPPARVPFALAAAAFLLVRCPSGARAAESWRGHLAHPSVRIVPVPPTIGVVLTVAAAAGIVTAGPGWPAPFPSAGSSWWCGPGRRLGHRPGPATGGHRLTAPLTSRFDYWAAVPAVRQLGLGTFVRTYVDGSPLPGPRRRHPRVACPVRRPRPDRPDRAGLGGRRGPRSARARRAGPLLRRGERAGGRRRSPCWPRWPLRGHRRRRVHGAGGVVDAAGAGRTTAALALAAGCPATTRTFTYALARRWRPRGGRAVAGCRRRGGGRTGGRAALVGAAAVAWMVAGSGGSTGSTLPITSTACGPAIGPTATWGRPGRVRVSCWAPPGRPAPRRGLTRVAPLVGPHPGAVAAGRSPRPVEAEVGGLAAVPAVGAAGHRRAPRATTAAGWRRRPLWLVAQLTIVAW